jgi:hypothetical protein
VPACHFIQEGHFPANYFDDFNFNECWEQTSFTEHQLMQKSTFSSCSVTTDTPNRTDELDTYKIELKQNYPNPFNPTTTIPYTLSKATMVSLDLYDIMGKKVISLVNQRQSEGSHSVNLNAANLSSGIYFYHLKTNTSTLIKKMILIK